MLQAVKLSDNLVLISGAGANVVVVIGPETGVFPWVISRVSGVPTVSVVATEREMPRPSVTVRVMV